MSSDVILVIVVGTALAFDFTNGFHDTANVVATSISTGAARPQVAIAIASLLNFVGAFISISVAATVANDVVNADVITPTIVFAGLIGAIAWNLITWSFGLPSSSSHALIGGVVGSAIAAAGFDAVIAEGLVGKVLIPALVAPVLAFVVAGLSIGLVYRVVGKQRPGTVTRGFKYGQIVSGGLLALAHGTNDAQKTMGVITLALIANGSLARRRRPAALGDRLVGGGDRRRHLQRRLADHQNHRHPDHQDGRRPGVLLAGRRRRGDPRLDPLRLPALDHPRDQRRHHGRRRRQALLGGALGGGREHRHRLGADPAGGGGDRGARLRPDADLRHRRPGPGAWSPWHRSR